MRKGSPLLEMIEEAEKEQELSFIEESRIYSEENFVERVGMSKQGKQRQQLQFRQHKSSEGWGKRNGTKSLTNPYLLSGVSNSKNKVRTPLPDSRQLQEMYQQFLSLKALRWINLHLQDQPQPTAKEQVLLRIDRIRNKTRHFKKNQALEAASQEYSRKKLEYSQNLKIRVVLQNKVKMTEEINQEKKGKIEGRRGGGAKRGEGDGRGKERGQGEKGRDQEIERWQRRIRDMVETGRETSYNLRQVEEKYRRELMNLRMVSRQRESLSKRLFLKQSGAGMVDIDSYLINHRPDIYQRALKELMGQKESLGQLKQLEEQVESAIQLVDHIWEEAGSVKRMCGESTFLNQSSDSDSSSSESELSESERIKPQHYSKCDETEIRETLELQQRINQWELRHKREEENVVEYDLPNQNEMIQFKRLFESTTARFTEEPFNQKIQAYMEGDIILKVEQILKQINSSLQI